MDTEIRWIAGDPAVQRDLEPLIRGLLEDRGVTWVRQHSDRRRLAHAALPGGRRCFLKHYRRGEHHPAREWWKRRLHLTSAEREWRTLLRLRAAGASVPEPLAHARLPAGEQIVVTAFVEGESLEAALATSRPERAALLAALGAVVRRLHEAGWVHRDLHRENIRVTRDGPVLLDFQAGFRSRLARARRNDLGELDCSLHRTLSIGDRVRLRIAALGLAPPFDEADREALRAVGRASVERGLAHARSRTRRCKHPGRRACRFEQDGGTGLLRRGENADAIRSLLADDSAPHPRFEVRRYRGGGARRDWVAAHGLDARGLDAPIPLAFVVWRRLGVPLRSALVLESPPKAAADPEGQLEALTRLWIDLHEARVEAPELDPSGVGFFERDGRLCARVDALDRVRFARRLSDRQRLDHLARLEAGLGSGPDDDPDDPCDTARCRALARYRARLPFPMSRDAVVAAMLSRKPDGGALRKSG